MARLSVTVTAELSAALRELAAQRGEELSRLVEVLLRENPLVAASIQKLRRRAAVPGLKKGRSLEELRLLGEVARARWSRDLASGEVKVPGWTA